MELDPELLDMLSDPVWEAVVRSARPQHGYRYIEPVAALQKTAIRVVARVSHNRDGFRSTNRFAVTDDQGNWIWEKPFVGLFEVAYSLRHDGWGDARITPADDTTKRTADRLSRLFQRLRR